MRKSMLVTLVFAIAIAVSFAFITTDEPRYKNLKVLKKNTTKKELDSVMHFFAMSLGERCTFCHVANEAAKSMDFASDANPNKGVARYMMKMNAKINKKYFKNQEKNSGNTVQSVTCYTCHHGGAKPLIKAPPKANTGGNMSGENRGAQTDSTKKAP
jgi:hypothetical protein